MLIDLVECSKLAGVGGALQGGDGILSVGDVQILECSCCFIFIVVNPSFNGFNKATCHIMCLLFSKTVMCLNFS